MKTSFNNSKIRIFQIEQKLKNAKQRENQTMSNFCQYLNRIYQKLNYIINDEKKLRILRRKTLKNIVFDFFKQTNIKIAITYQELQNIYIIIENTLRNINQIKKINIKVDDTSNNSKFNNDNQISKTNNTCNENKL